MAVLIDCLEILADVIAIQGFKALGYVAIQGFKAIGYVSIQGIKAIGYVIYIRNRFNFISTTCIQLRFCAYFYMK